MGAGLGLIDTKKRRRSGIKRESLKKSIFFWGFIFLRGRNKGMKFSKEMKILIKYIR